MVLHQPLDNPGPEHGGFGILNRDPRSVRGGRHASHDELAVRILFVFKLLHRALPAGAYRSQRRMPAEIRKIASKRQARVQQVLVRIGLPRFVFDVDCCHRHLHGQRFSVMCRSKSSAKYLSALCSGSIAPGANAQNVFPGRKKFGLKPQASPGHAARRGLAPSPAESFRTRRGRSSTACTIRTTPGQRSESGSKPCRPDRSCRQVPPSCPCPGGCRLSGRWYSPWACQGVLRQENRWRRRRELLRETEGRRACLRRSLPESRESWCQAAVPTAPAASLFR